MSRYPSGDAALDEAYEQARKLAAELTEMRRKMAIRYARAGHHGLKAICKMVGCDFATLTKWLIEVGQCLKTQSEERCGKCAGCQAKKGTT